MAGISGYLPSDCLWSHCAGSSVGDPCKFPATRWRFPRHWRRGGTRRGPKERNADRAVL